MRRSAGFLKCVAEQVLGEIVKDYLYLEVQVTGNSRCHKHTHREGKGHIEHKKKNPDKIRWPV